MPEKCLESGGRLKIVTWNVNGLRAVLGKGFLQWVKKEKPDVLCLQEIKVHEHQLPPEIRFLEGYHCHFNPAKKPGYAGTALFSREKPDEIWTGLKTKESRDEGRVLAARFGSLQVICAYYPNSQPEGKRKDVKLEFCRAMLEKCLELRKKKQEAVVCGDYNIAHTEIDLARPRENEENPGFFIWERQAMTEFFQAGHLDIFREQHPGEKGLYTWWSFRGGARERNVGWRIDYTCVSPGLAGRAKKSYIQPEVMGSDHCPVGLLLE
jgi:exodeoxyribonuclease-3